MKGVLIRVAAGLALMTTFGGGLDVLSQTEVPVGSPAPPTAPAPATSGGVTINAGTGQLVTNSALSTAPPLQSMTSPRAQRSKITPLQLQNINRLMVELNRLATPVREPDQDRALLETLKTAPVASVRPTTELITQLSSNLASTLPTLRLTAPQRRQLAIDLNLALNSGNLSSTEADRVMADARSLLQGSSVNNPDGVDQLVSSLGAIVSHVQSHREPSNSEAASAQPQPATDLDPGSTPTGQSGESQSGQGSGESKAP